MAKFYNREDHHIIGLLVDSNFIIVDRDARAHVFYFCFPILGEGCQAFDLRSYKKKSKHKLCQIYVFGPR